MEEVPDPPSDDPVCPLLPARHTAPFTDCNYPKVYCWAIIGHGASIRYRQHLCQVLHGQEEPSRTRRTQKNQTDGAFTNGHVRKGQDEEEENEVEEEEEENEEE